MDNFPKQMICNVCKYENKITEGFIFQRRNKENYLFFKCPKCDSIISFHVSKIFNPEVVTGYEDIKKAKVKRYIPFLYSFIYTVLAGVLVFYFENIYTFIIACFFEYLAFDSLRLAYHGSDEEIRKLTE
jgi:hypothetical protein